MSKLNIDCKDYVKMLLATKPISGHPFRPYGLDAVQHWNRYIGDPSYKGKTDWKMVGEFIMLASEILNNKSIPK